ncbi:MAG: amidase [Acidimicrobiales bacterium]
MTTWLLRHPAGAGRRVAVKDLIEVAGEPTTAASRAVAATAAPAPADAPCLAGLRAAIAAGEACYVGKTNLHELAYGITGINVAFGTPVNPLDARRVPGGSSSGGAVAVADGEADVAYGSDTGGSIRIPAACCGVAGLKTTHGRIPLEGVRPLAPSFDTVGPMARDVAGLVAGMALLEPGFALGDIPENVRVGRVPIAAEAPWETAVDDALAAVGWAVAPTTLPDVDTALAAAMTLLDAETWISDGDLLRAAPELIGDDVRDRLRRAARVGPAEVAAARRIQSDWCRAVDEHWERFDVLAFPTLLADPPLLDDAGRMPASRGLNAAVNLARLPAVALPVPKRGGGLPASIQLVGSAGSEEGLLAIAGVLEAASGR